MIGLLLAAATPHAAPPIVTFPGRQTSVPSPTSSARVFYVEMGADNGGQNLSLRFSPGGPQWLLLKRFDRSVDIGWSPSGRRFFVNDYIGSDIADCLIVRPQGAGVRGLSLMRAIARNARHPRETRYNSHYYVTCNRWASDTTVDGEIDGHTDEPAIRPYHPHAFRHHFTWDSATGRIRWRRSEIWDPNRWGALPVLPGSSRGSGR